MKNVLTVFTVCFALSASANSFADSAKFYYAKGIEEKNAKRYQIASTNFDKAIKFNAKYAEAFLENAIVNLEMRRTDIAKAHFAKVHELQPSNTLAIKELATLFYSYRQWDKAIEFVNKCGNCENKDRIIGLCNYEKENYLEAEKYLLKALTIEPNDGMLNYKIAQNYIQMEAVKKAIPFFEKAVTLEPTKINWMYELGILYYDNRNYRSAATAFESAEKKGYTVNNDFIENYGYALMYGGRFEAGELKLMEIYKKKGNKELLRNIAQTLYSFQQYDRCLNYCQKLLEIDPKDGKALYQAGLTFIKMGKKDKGQGMCDKAIELDPTLAGKKSSVGGMGGGL